MAKLATTVALKGQSRSTYCAATVPGSKSLCHRLTGHKGDHRATLQSSVAPKVDGWADRMPVDGKMQTAATLLKRAAARKGAKARKAGPKVRNIPAATVDRMVADSRNGQLGKRAGRPKVAPVINSKSAPVVLTVSEALGL